MNENSLKEIVRKYYLDYLNREPEKSDDNVVENI
ncbi:uncharacterized protein METZ01_LOCUS318703, partial [marine metagenome]